jgi:hypothetical protein
VFDVYCGSRRVTVDQNELCRICDQLRLGVPGLCLGVPGKGSGSVALAGDSPKATPDPLLSFVENYIKSETCDW